MSSNQAFWRHQRCCVHVWMTNVVVPYVNTKLLQLNAVNIVLISGKNAVIEYSWIEDSVIDLYHTEVPPSHRGRGLAQLLAKVNFAELLRPAK